MTPVITPRATDRKSTRLNSSHVRTSYAVFCLKKKRCGDDLQGPAARHRCPTAIHGFPLHRARPLARRIPPRPLRCPARREAAGGAVRVRNVPHHRGPHLRRHRDSDQPARPGAPHPPPAPHAGGPAFLFSVAPPTEIYTLSLHDALPI